MGHQKARRGSPMSHQIVERIFSGGERPKSCSLVKDLVNDLLLFISKSQCVKYD